MMEAVKDKPWLSCEEMMGRDNEGTFLQSGGCHGGRPGALREVIMMHEGLLHVYDMIASDLLAPRGN